MSIDQLDLILYDMYRMDAWLPPLFGKWTEDYKKASYSQWAVDELRDFIAERIYPRKEGSIDEFCKLTHEFMMKTAKYARVNPNTSLKNTDWFTLAKGDNIFAFTADSGVTNLQFRIENKVIYEGV